MQKVKQVCNCRAKALDFQFVNLPDMVDDCFCSVAAHAVVQQLRECQLVLRILVNIRNAQLGFPKERMVSSFEHLSLFCDGFHDRFQRRAAIGHTKCARLDLVNNFGDATTDGSEILNPLLPQKPIAIGGTFVRPPLQKQLACHVTLGKLHFIFSTPIT